MLVRSPRANFGLTCGRREPTLRTPPRDAEAPATAVRWPGLRRIRRRVMLRPDRSLLQAVLRPVLGVGLGVLPHHRAVDRVDLHEAAHRRRRVGAVEQDAPDRARPQAVPARAARSSARPRSRPCATRSAAPRSGRWSSGHARREVVRARSSARKIAGREQTAVARLQRSRARRAPRVRGTWSPGCAAAPSSGRGTGRRRR